MAKLTGSDTTAALCEGEPTFSSGLEYFLVGLSSEQSQITYQLHLTPSEARQLAAYVLAHDKTLPEVERRVN
jgi:hypothetical protein